MSSATDEESLIDSAAEITLASDADRTQDMSFAGDDDDDDDDQNKESDSSGIGSSIAKLNKSIHEMSIRVDPGSGSGSEADDEEDEEEEKEDQPEPKAVVPFIATRNSNTALISQPVELELFDEDERELLGDDFVNTSRQLTVATTSRKSARKSIVILSSGNESDEGEEEVVVVKKSKKKALNLSSSSSSSESPEIITAPKEAKKEKSSPSPVLLLPPPQQDSDGDDDLMIISPAKPPVQPKSIIQPKMPTKARLNIAKLAGPSEEEKKKQKKPLPIMNWNRLEKTTRLADRAEKERVKRLAAKEKAFERAFDAADPATALILDFDVATSRPLVRINKSLGKQLKPHQVEGVKFMYQTVIESVERLQEDEENEEELGGSGCILAHSMGLGKTLQVVTFLHTVLTCRHTAEAIQRVLIVVPFNVIENWAQEFDKWVERCRLDWDITIYEMRLEKTTKKRVDLLRTWYKRGGVLLITNALFARIVSSLEEMADRASARAFRTYLLSPGPDLLVIDEGHLLKNEDSQLNRALTLVETRRRVILTGTPLQNNLAEYFTMVDYVKPRRLGTRQEFKNRFQAPIEAGQNKDSAPFEVVHMKKRIHVLHQLLTSVIHRCDYRILVPYLPPKAEHVLAVALTEKQKEMYRHYLNFYADKSARKSLFRDKNLLAHIWTHPILIHDYRVQSKGKETFVNEIGDWYLRYLSPEEDATRLELSSKLTLVFALLEACEKKEEKVVIFSQSLLVLDLIERLLRVKSQEAAAKGEKGSFGRWRKDVDYFRIDGGVDVDERSEVIERFNDAEERRARLMLVSTRAGGIGINLVGANRAVIFDASFNPANDLQAIFRIYRLGQTKPVFVYRMVAYGTMEEKIYRKQIVKQSLSRRVIDEQQVVRHYAKVEVEELYKLDDDYSAHADAVLPITATDDLLNDLIYEHKGLVLAVHEHDSLLEASPDEELTEEERRAAWEEFEKAKKEVVVGGAKGGKKAGTAAGGKNGSAAAVAHEEEEDDDFAEEEMVEEVDMVSEEDDDDDEEEEEAMKAIQGSSGRPAHSAELIAID
ncbi:PREDICTED: transcriptional regulator ATRX homolog [Rhagoletis zephyria]|uniref:transcriptional regulator ATRX homolog n=1 Tax=Rhagoletis zephyria TaxID=28612 RepID=UPI0008116980|nr:PREDICTED: transcriptional regulator ATRX homolog [Rhagoletis zephyria]